MVGRRTLNPLIGVRLPVPQPQKIGTNPMKPIFNKHFRKSVWQKNHTVMRYLKYVWKKHPFITSGIALLTMIEAAIPAAVAYINALLLDGILKASIENYPSI